MFATQIRDELIVQLSERRVECFVEVRHGREERPTVVHEDDLLGSNRHLDCAECYWDHEAVDEKCR